MPLPRSNLRDLERHPEPLLVFANALVCAIERGGALVDAALQFHVCELQRSLRLLALGHFALQRVVQLRERAALPEQIDEDVDLRSEDLGVDRLAQIVDGADAVSA